jgi:hypothetical protein
MIINFPKILDKRGNLTFLQFPDQVPFDIKRAFWTYDVPGGEMRGGHAYNKQTELIVALSGSFDIVITDKYGDRNKLSLNRPYYGILIPALTWRHMENFSTNSLGLHLSDSSYDENDYIRDFLQFKNLK